MPIDPRQVNPSERRRNWVQNRISSRLSGAGILYADPESTPGDGNTLEGDASGECSRESSVRRLAFGQLRVP